MAKDILNEHSGVVFHNNIEFKALENRNGKGIYSLMEILLVIFGVTSMCWCFITGMELLVMPQIILVGIIISTLFFYAVFYFRKYRILSLPLILLVYGIAIHIYYTDLQEGIFHVENQFIELYNRYYGVGILKFLVKEENPSYYSTVLLLFVMVAITAVVTYFTCYHKVRWIYLIMTLPGIICPLVLGVVPDSFWFASYIISSIAILGSHSLEHHYGKSAIQIKTSWMLFLIGMLLFVVIYSIFTPKQYEKNVDIDKVKQNIQTNMMEIQENKVWKNSIFGDLFQVKYNIANGGVNGGKLGRVNEIAFTNTTALQVELPEQVKNATYLRSFVGSVYNGNSWEQLSGQDKRSNEALRNLFERDNISYDNPSGFVENTLNRLNENMQEQVIKIQCINENPEHNFIPYFIYNPIKIDDKGYNQLIGRENRDNYWVNYSKNSNEFVKQWSNSLYSKQKGNFNLAMSGMPVPQAEIYKNDMKEYRFFINGAYTGVPKNSKAAKLFEKEQIDPSHITSAEIQVRIKLVREYLNKHTKYSLSPGMLPKGKDFVDYFLFEKQTGYCTHYATAATILLRSMGVPARYAEGYIITEKDISSVTVPDKAKTRTITVKDTNAHAWVEVFLDQYGWIPVEFTPGYGGVATGNTKPENMVAPVKKEIPTPTPVQKEKLKKAVKSNADKGIAISAAWQRIFKLGICILGIMILLAAGISIRREVYLFRYRKLLQNEDRNKKTIFIYQQMKKVFAYYGVLEQEGQTGFSGVIENRFDFIGEGEFEEVYGVILKAGFSEYMVTEEEYQRVLEFFDSFKINLEASGSKRERAYFKWVCLV